MKAERWQQINQLLQAALERNAAQRGAFLDQACAGDDDLRREIESLLAVNMPTNDFLSQPAIEVAAGMLSATLLNQQDNLPLAAGVMLDNRYLIERELGRGGMGVVFLARDKNLSRMQVVVKVLLEQRLNDPSQEGIGVWLKKKFSDEKEALARLRHPGIVRPTDAGELPGGQAYLVMEYVPGCPLRKAISPTGMELGRAARLIHQIAQALAAAHKEGVIHRDLKPENILLLEVDGEEQIRLIDFGIATVRDAMSASSLPLTRVAGTGAYMAPEQLRGKPETASDIYALGVIAYELVTGRRPFNAVSLTHLGELQRQGIKVKPRELRSDLPEAAETAILKSLAFDPADRYQDAREFGNQFRQAIEAVDPLQTNVGVLPQEQTPFYPDAPPTQRFPSRRRLLVPAAALLAVLLLGFLVWQKIPAANDGKAMVTASNPATVLPAVPERTLLYSLTVQKNPQRYPGHQPFATFGDITVGAGDGLRLKLSSPQPGYLYIINEWPPQPNRQPGFTVLFPNPNDNRGSAQINAHQEVQLPPDKWLRFVEEKGTEKYWLVWATQRVPELAALTPDDLGEVHNRRQIEAVQQFLNAHPTTEFKAEPDKARQQIKLSGKTNVLVGLVKLDHR